MLHPVTATSLQLILMRLLRFRVISDPLIFQHRSWSNSICIFSVAFRMLSQSFTLNESCPSHNLPLQIIPVKACPLSQESAQIEQVYLRQQHLDSFLSTILVPLDAPTLFIARYFSPFGCCLQHTRCLFDHRERERKGHIRVIALKRGEELNKNQEECRKTKQNVVIDALHFRRKSWVESEREMLILFYIHVNVGMRCKQTRVSDNANKREQSHYRILLN